MPSNSNSIHFSIFDYILFSLTLLISISIGTFYAFRSWKAKSGIDDFLIGSRLMPVIPTALSLLASYVSGISIISYPVEIYSHGLVFLWFPISAILSVSLSGLFILPILYPMRNTISIYDYFYYRFNSPFLRSYIVILYQLSSLAYLAVVMYAPSIALANVTGVNVNILIITIGLVCTFYTSMGGLKAVVWTDFIQVFIIYAGLLALAIKGTMMVGGVRNVFETAYDTGRIETILNIDPNPIQYMTMWTGILGGLFYWLGAFGPDQTTLQRYCSLPTIKKARMAILLNIPSMLLMMLLIMYIGLTMLAQYSDCDPRKTETDLKNDQFLITFILDTLGSTYGLPGLFVACVCSATLSSVSSFINSLCAVFLENIAKPLNRNRPFPENGAKLITKCVGVLYGLIGIGLAFCAGPLGGIFKAVTGAVGGLTGPILGAFLLGMFFPCANWMGTFTGSLFGLGIVLWIFTGSFIYNVSYPELSTTIDKCPYNFTNTTISNWMGNNTNQLFSPDLYGIQQIYAISNIMYPVIGALLTVLFGLIISLMTGGNGQDYKNTPFTFWTRVRQ